MTDIPLDTRPTLSKIRKAGSKRPISLKDFPKEWLASPSELPSAGVGRQGGAEKKEVEEP